MHIISILSHTIWFGGTEDVLSVRTSSLASSPGMGLYIDVITCDHDE